MATENASSEVTLELPTNSQLAPRPYTSSIICFPFDAALGSKEQAVDALQKGLDLAVSYWPYLGGQIMGDHDGGSGRISIRYHADAGNRSRSAVPLHFQDREENTQLDYGSLRENGYPAGAFKSELLSPTEPFPHYSQPAPVLTVTANFVRGGLLLAVFFHHGVSDGHSVARFIELLARCTRAKSGQSIPDGLSLADLWVGRLEETLGLSTLDPQELIRSIPEHVIAPDINLHGPSQPVRLPRGRHESDHENPVTSVIFTIASSRVADLKNTLNDFVKKGHGPGDYVTTNAVLGALVWAHITNVRFPSCTDIITHDLQSSPGSSPVTPLPSPNTPLESPTYPLRSPDDIYCNITIPVNNRFRLVPQLPKTFMGYAVSIANGSMPLQMLRMACIDPGALAEVAWIVRQAGEAVDDAFVRRRLELVKAIPDVRVLRMSYDVEDGTGIRFNNWADRSMHVPWGIPGVPAIANLDGALPDAIRRGQDGYTNGSCIVLPRRSDSGSWELWVQLRERDMDRLCSDDTWTCIVDRLVK